VAGRAFAQVFGKPGLGLHCFVQNSQRRVVGAMVLTDSVDRCPQAGGLRRFQGARLRLCVMQIHAVIGPGNGVHPASRNQNRAVVKPISGFHIQVA